MTKASAKDTEQQKQSFFVPELGRSIEAVDLADVEKQVAAERKKQSEAGDGDS